MYDIMKSLAQKTLEKDVFSADQTALNAEGMALVRWLTGGVENVRRSRGATGEDFVGFSTRDNQSITTEVVVEQHTVPSAGTLIVTMDHDNISTGTNDLRIICHGLDTARINTKFAATLTIITSGAIGNDQVLVDYTNGTCTFHAGEAGEAVTIIARRNLTAVESKQKYYQRNINNQACDDFGRVGVLTGQGQMYTDQFVVNENYSNMTGGNGDFLHTGASGRVTRFGNGDRVGSLIKLPTTTDSYLGIAFNTDAMVVI